jgi:hypothetical protein
MAIRRTPTKEHDMGYILVETSIHESLHGARRPLSVPPKDASMRAQPLCTNARFLLAHPSEREREPGRLLAN